MSNGMLPPRTRWDTLHNLIWGALAVLAWTLAISYAWTLRPLDPVPKLELTVLGPLHAGSDIRARVDYCKTEGFTPSAVRWSLVDGVTIMLPDTIVTLTPGCHVVTLILPGTPHMVPGSYMLRVDGVYAPYPWRASIIESATSKPFDVVP